MTINCGRCGKQVEEKNAEHCWWCVGYLCYDCWEDVGHCGHEEAERMNELARQVQQP